MRRQRKHRHHPDIWRERHLAEKLAERRWYNSVEHDWWRSANAEMLEPRAVFAGADFIAAFQAIWDGCAPLVTVAHVGPEALVITGVNPLRVEPPS